MRRIINENKGQMLVIETILFTVMVFMALFFVYQLSSPPAVDQNITRSELKILGDDALKAIDDLPTNAVGSYYNSKLIRYVAQNKPEELYSDLGKILPDYVGYNLYLSDGDNVIKFYDGEQKVDEKIGLVSRSHVLIILTKDIVDENEWSISDVVNPDESIDMKLISNSAGEQLYLPVIDVILEMWYI